MSDHSGILCIKKLKTQISAWLTWSTYDLLGDTGLSLENGLGEKSSIIHTFLNLVLVITDLSVIRVTTSLHHHCLSQALYIAPLFLKAHVSLFSAQEVEVNFKSSQISDLISK